MADASFIPPGQEELVGGMLGNGVTLPGDCKLVSGNLEKSTIMATYSCPAGEVVVELAHPSAAPTDAARTEKFALQVERGTAPPDLPDALLARIRERESQFQWSVHPDGAPDPPPGGPVPMLSSAVALGVLLIAALLLRRRRARATQG
jgi:hypothetical protein